jgi:predicted nucleic acid-binding protein
VIVLDTNVLSEPLKHEPDQRVITWLESVDEALAVTAVSMGELLVGARRLPLGQRRDALLAAIERVLEAHGGDILPYDEQAARRYAEMQESRRAAGRPLSVEDGMIAAICARHGARLATRNIGDFESLGIDLIDPWLAPSNARPAD